MSYPQYHDMNMGADILTHMSIESALKEIIANALDEHQSNDIKKDINITQNSKKEWIISDCGSGIKKEHFIFNINPHKKKDHTLRGMFSFGLKDSIANLFSKGIEVKIYTKKFIYTPVMKVKYDDIETLHIEQIKNTTYEIDCGSQFVFKKLTKKHIEKAKSKFIEFLKPEIFFSFDGFDIFKLNSYQSIFINGVEVYNNTGFHFSYNMKSTKLINKQFNRDRTDINLTFLKNQITTRIKKYIDFTNMDEELFVELKNILLLDTKLLQEFSSIDVLRNIIIKLNNTDKYIFIGKNEVIENIILQKIKDDKKEIFHLGNGILKKFNIRVIKYLYTCTKMYSGKNKESKKINTLMNYISIPSKLELKQYLEKTIKPLEKRIIILPKIKENILNIEIFNDDIIDSLTNKKIKENKSSDDENENYEDESYEDNKEIKNIDDSNGDNSDSENSDSNGDDSDNESKTDIIISENFKNNGYDFDSLPLKMKQKYIDEKNKKELCSILFKYIISNLNEENIVELFCDKQEIQFDKNLHKIKEEKDSSSNNEDTEEEYFSEDSEYSEKS